MRFFTPHVRSAPHGRGPRPGSSRGTRECAMSREYVSITTGTVLEPSLPVVGVSLSISVIITQDVKVWTSEDQESFSGRVSLF